MKTKIGILVLALCTTFFGVQAQRTVTTTRATSNDISDNLDLNAVASIFGDSQNLEDFEHRLNDPDNRISNLDLNGDGYVDYLRVVENSSQQNSLVVIQAVLDNEVYQDVATIEIEKVSDGNPHIQIVGNDYIYGSNYIVEPIFYRTPLIFSFLWGPHYSPWHSPYYWNYYPRWYRNRSPFSPFRYRRNIYAHINIENKYRRSANQDIHFSGNNFDNIRRNDYATKHPERSFVNRHESFDNRNQLNERQPNRSVGYPQNSYMQRPNTKVRPNSTNPGSGSYERRPTNEYRSPVYQEKSGAIQTQPRESNRQQPANRIEPTRSNPVSTEKSVSQPTRTRSNREVKQSQPSTRKSESPQKQEKKESRERRRSE